MGPLATKCEVHAAIEDHVNLALIHEASDKATGEVRQALKGAYEEVEEEEDEHPLPHRRLEPRALDRIARDTGRSSAARRGEGSEDRHRCGPRQACSERHAAPTTEGILKMGDGGVAESLGILPRLAPRKAIRLRPPAGSAAGYLEHGIANIFLVL
jgi:hypothetical protein